MEVPAGAVETGAGSICQQVLKKINIYLAKFGSDSLVRNYICRHNPPFITF